MKTRSMAMLVQLLVFAAATAQETPSVRFLPVGEAPPFRQEVRDGVRQELEAPAGSIPPREVSLAVPQGEATVVKLALNRASAAMTPPAGDIVLKEGSGSEWTTVKRGTGGSLLVLFARQPEAPTWEKPRALPLPDNGAEFPAGSCHFVNFSTVAVALVFGEEKIALKPGVILKRTLSASKPAVCQIAHGDGKGGLTRFHAGELSHAAGERTLVVIYPADGKAPRQPLRVLVHRETVPAAP